MNSSQTPHGRRSRIGLRRPSQALKSPTTDTRAAAGAQTAKITPATPSISAVRAPRHSSTANGSPPAKRASAASSSSGPNA